MHYCQLVKPRHDTTLSLSCTVSEIEKVCRSGKVYVYIYIEKDS
jgi:hypothetical protein